MRAVTRGGCSRSSTTKAATPAISSCSTPPTSRDHRPPPCISRSGCRSGSTAGGCRKERRSGSRPWFGHELDALLVAGLHVRPHGDVADAPVPGALVVAAQRLVSRYAVKAQEQLS